MMVVPSEDSLTGESTLDNVTVDDIVANYLLIDPCVQSEEHDFVDEAITFLGCAHKMHIRTEQSSNEWESHMHKLSERQKKHLMLYNWIATTIVREARGDVAAVTVARMKKVR